MSSFRNVLIGGVCLAGAAGLACAQTYPMKTVRVINPFAPGGGVDIVMRPVLEKMSANLQQGFVLVVHPALAVSNVRDLVMLAKRRPGELTFGSPGFGGINFMGATLFSQLADIRMTHVPFKGSLPMLTDIMGGHVLLAFDSTQATLPHVRSKRLRALGIAAQKRSPIAPEIPTIVESGGPEFVLSAWYGLLGPAALSRDVTGKLHTEAVKALAAPELRERYGAVGLEPLGNGPEVFAKTLREDYERWGKVTRAANIRIE